VGRKGRGEPSARQDIMCHLSPADDANAVQDFENQAAQAPLSLDPVSLVCMDILGGIFGGNRYRTIASEFLSVFRKITIRPSEVLYLYRLVSSPGFPGRSRRNRGRKI